MKNKKIIIIIVAVIILGLGTYILLTNSEEPFIDEVNPVAGTILDFKALDINEKEIDSNVFKEQELIVINIWATSCSPCIKEMGDFQAISDEYKGKIRVIGLVTNSDKKKAKEILDELDVTFTNIMEDTSLKQQIVDYFQYVPVTLFVNKDGKILEPYFAGSTDYEHLKYSIDNILYN